MKKRWEIWAETYLSLGNVASATFVGTGYGNIFADAVEDLYTRRKAAGNDVSTWSLEHLSVGGCRLYSSEADATRAAEFPDS